MIRTLGDVERALQPYVDYSSMMHRGDVTIDRTLMLSQYVGSPHERLRVVHVAGTSGKTSTSYYIRELLEQAGQTTGLTVSPHMITIADRVQVGGAPLPEKKFVRYFNEFLAIAKHAPIQPSYFELLIVFALWVFDKEKVDYAVLETGLGGLNDSTNICQRADKVCVLTDIGFDHMHVLGDTLAEIARQKSGIIARDNHVVMFEQPREVMDVVRTAALRMNAQLESARLHDIAGRNTIIAEYQQRNWSLAYAAYRYIANRDRLSLLDETHCLETMQVTIPGRMEVLDVGNTTVILDGAHNEQKMRTFWGSFEHKFPGVQPTIVLGMKQGKELSAVAPILKKYSNDVIATMATTMQDMPIGAIDPSDIAAAVGDGTEVIRNSVDALQTAVHRNATVVVTGSLYLVSEIRAFLNTHMV